MGEDGGGMTEIESRSKCKKGQMDERAKTGTKVLKEETKRWREGVKIFFHGKDSRRERIKSCAVSVHRHSCLL